jgi:hypothetical protein
LHYCQQQESFLEDAEKKSILLHLFTLGFLNLLAHFCIIHLREFHHEITTNHIAQATARPIDFEARRRIPNEVRRL